MRDVDDDIHEALTCEFAASEHWRRCEDAKVEEYDAQIEEVFARIHAAHRASLSQGAR